MISGRLPIEGDIYLLNMQLKEFLKLQEQLGSAAAPTGEYTFQGTGNYGVGGRTQMANGKLSKPTQRLEDQEIADYKTQAKDANKDAISAIEEQHLEKKSSWDSRTVKDAEYQTMSGATPLVKNMDQLNGHPDNKNTPSVLGGTGALAAPKNFVPTDVETLENPYDPEEPHLAIESLIVKLTREIINSI